MVGHCSKLKKIMKLTAHDTVDTAQIEKLTILSDMCVNVKDVLHNDKYMRLYYPLDEEIRNRGKLTLIHPLYCDLFSSILCNIKEVIKCMVETSNDVIPDKDLIKQRMAISNKNEKTNDINDLVLAIKKRIILTVLLNKDLIDIIWEIIERVLNASVGEFVREYRRKVLVRINTVAFRTELAVKSEKK